MKVGRHVMSLVALLAGAGLLWGAWAVAIGDAEGEAAELASLRSAPMCDGPPREPAACIWHGDFEFVGSEHHRADRSDWYSIDIRDTRPDEDGSPGFVRTIEYFEREDVQGLTYRTPMTATLWRGRIIEVRIDGRDLPTSEHPREPRELSIFAGISMAVGGLVLAVAGLSRLVTWRRRPSIAQRVAVRAGIGLPIIGLLASAFASELSNQTTEGIGVRQIVLFIVALTMAGGGLAYIHFRRVRADVQNEVTGD